MLLKVLDEIKESRYKSINEIAAKLSITESFMNHLIDELIKRGYLKKIDQDCESIQCINCTIIKSCKENKENIKNVIYILTEKGLKSYLDRNFNVPAH